MVATEQSIASQTVIKNSIAHAQSVEMLTPRSPEHTQASREKLLGHLPPRERKFIENNFKTFDSSLGMMGKLLGPDLRQNMEVQQKLLNSGRLNEEDRKDVQSTLDYMQRLADTYWTENERMTQTLKRVQLEMANQAGFAKVDRYTGLFLRTAVLDEFNREIFSRWLENPDSVNLSDHVIYALDMNNFKAGNTILGHDGFDQFIAAMCKDFITTSQYLSQDAAEERVYGKYNPDDPNAVKSIDRMFPPDSRQRTLLEDARKQGIYIDFYRDKAGADEAMFFIHYNQGKTPEREQLAEAVIDHIFHSHSLPKHPPEALPTLQNTAETFAEHLKFKEDPEERMAEAAGLNVDMNVLNYLNGLADYIQQDLKQRGCAANIVSDPQMQLHMGASWTKTDMNQAFARFIYGMGQNGANGDGLIDPTTGKENHDRINAYAQHISDNVHLIVDAMGMQDDITENTGYITELTQQEAANPIIGAAVGEQFHLVDEQVKPFDKFQMMVDAMRGSPNDLYQLAALVQDGRLLDTLTPKSKLMLLVSLESFYHDGYRAQVDKYLGDDAIRMRDCLDDRAAYEDFLTQKSITRDQLRNLEVAYQTLA